MERGVWKGYAPGHWRLVRPASASDAVTLSFAVKQTNLRELEATLLEVSDPRSAKYGKHLTLEQVCLWPFRSLQANCEPGPWALHNAGA